MKHVSAIFALLILGSITKVTAQTSGNSIKPAINQQTARQFLDIAFTPQSTNSTTVPKAPELAAVDKRSDNPDNNIEHFASVQFKYAMMMDVNVETLTDASLYNFVEDWTGTRYRMGGSTKRGIDCSAFTSTLLMAVYSISAPRTAREQYNATKKVTKEELTEGDLVFFNTTGGISHVGVYLSNGYFVHSCSSEGVTISSLDDAYYLHHFVGGGRMGK